MSDPVRVEVEMALKRDIPVIPVLVSGMKMPEAGQLPATLKDFAFRHAVEVDGGRDFDHHIEGLARALDQIFAAKGMAPPERKQNVAAPIVNPAVVAPAAQSFIGQTPPRRLLFSLPVLFGAVGLLVGVALTAVIAIMFLRSGKPPSFDCYAAMDADEQEICRNSELAELDRSLAVAYSVLRAHLDKDKQTALAADENAWRERRKACNKDDTCIRAAYIMRLRQLRNWQ
jgi:uncharacterized protein YecT (DUF1311 family)